MALPFHDETVLLLSYADDLALVVSRRGDKLRRTQHALDLISKKCEELGLKFSTEKSRAMMVKAASQPTLRGSSACKELLGWLAWTSSCQYLGVLVDKRLSFTAHVACIPEGENAGQAG